MNKKTKQILAIVAIVLLVGMYVSSLVFSMINTDLGRTMLKISFTCTITIPVIIYVLMMMFRLTHRDDDNTGRDDK